MGTYGESLVVEVVVRGTLPIGETVSPINHYIVDMDRKAIVGQVVLPNALKQETPVSMTVKVPVSAASLEIGTFDANGSFQPSGILTVSAPVKSAGTAGPWGR